MPEDGEGKMPIQPLNDWKEALDSECPIMIIQLEDPDDGDVATFCIPVGHSKSLARDLIKELVKTDDPYAKVLDKVIEIPSPMIEKMAAQIDEYNRHNDDREAA
jgi:hypothetical protein